MTATGLPSDFDFTDPDTMLAGVPHAEHALARQTSPVHWVEQPQSARDGMEGGSGYWAVSRHADVARVSKDSKNFSSAENSAIIRFPEGMLREMIEFQRVMLLNQDEPEHTQTRQIISRGFTPRSIAALDGIMTERAHRIVADAVAKGEVDFVTEVAAELPLQAIADLLGVPQEDRKKLFDWSNQMLAGEDPEFEGQSDVAAAEILGYAMTMAADRKANPRDDIVTKLLNADKDGRGLTDDEFGYFVIILTVAGNETTRNAISHGMDAFLDHPDQWDLWVRERPSTMVDEVIRWATPVNVFQRTAINDVEVGGQLVKAGRARRSVLRLRKPRRVRLHRPAHVRHHPRPEPAPRVRRPRCALLHRRQPGPAGGQDHVRRPRRPDHLDRRVFPTPSACGTAGSTASRSCASGSSDAGG